MSNGIEIEGLEDLEKTIQGMTITEPEIKAAVKNAIKPIAEEIEKNTPQRSGKLKKLSKTVKNEGLATVGVVRTKMFYDMFQEFGTSQQKRHIGYFDRSVTKSQEEALKIITKKLLEDKIK